MASAPQSMCPGYSGDGTVIIDMLHMCNLLFGSVALHADGVAVSIPRQLMWVWSGCHCLAVKELVCTPMPSVLSMYICGCPKHAQCMLDTHRNS